MPPGRSGIHAPPPLSPVINNHQSNRSAAPGMPPNMYPVNSVSGHRGRNISSRNNADMIC